MKLEILNVSVVVAAEAHNPTILHPEFLRGRNIVPEGWESSEELICTAALSVVKAKDESIVFTVQPTKFQIVDNIPGTNPASSRAPGIAAKYIGALPHVRYTAVGMNCGGFLELSTPEERLIERFLKPGDPWQRQFPPQAMGLRLVFTLPEGRLTLSIDAGTLQKRGEELRHGCLVNANCHVDLPKESVEKALEKAGNILGRF